MSGRYAPASNALAHAILRMRAPGWLYSEAPEEVTADQLDARWMELLRQFEPDVDWSKYAYECASSWQQNGQIFAQPFYMFEYTLAHMRALQIYRKACIDHATTWQTYRDALKLGGTRSLPDLFQAAGADFPLQPEVVKSIAGFLAPLLLHPSSSGQATDRRKNVD